MALDLGSSMFLDLAAAAAAYGRLDEEDPLMKPDSSPSQDSSSLNPPAYGYPDGGANQPRLVFIEPYAYFADRHNATTAGCSMEGLRLRGNIEVTFCTAQPPQVSYLCVHATAYDHTVFAVRPHIVTAETDGGLVLLCVVVGDRPSDALLRHKRHYFVYDASVPSLKHLPHPGNDHRLNEQSFAIVRKPDCSYVLAVQAGVFGCRNPSANLCLYHSGTNSWRKLPVNVDSVPYDEFITYKAFTIGGDEGTLAWVDLSHMIIFCNVLDRRPKLRFLRLPTEPTYAGGSPAVRDVSVIDGFIKHVELQHRADGWKATIWSIKTGVFSKKAWRVDYRFPLIYPNRRCLS